MENILPFLIELAHTSPHHSKFNELISEQSKTIQDAFLQANTCQIKKLLSNNENEYFANERTVFSLHD